MRQRWSLNQQAFDALLGHLDPDREKAGLRFEVLRRKLLQYFSYEACRQPDKWADETLDRVAKRIADGTLIEDVNVFTRGVARLVLREARLAESRDHAITEITAHVAATNKEEDEADAACLEACIAALPPATRDLVEHYYLAAGESRPAARKALAARLGIEMDALRTRALRARRQLEFCLQQCREKPLPNATNHHDSPLKNRS
jgi:DNA-directed RNA polymerase specialized sigma24 family protein